ncbi:uncharacterized protein LOC132561926 [Ylistrum balloti]|uniref:uncharacterized protein LOC132561926 n=1 Tax=Ylistrum balloti TaxID=509963 RepID=UPI002905C56F|nr:uncharacterized protein LOC132561926 [Ylistrum balloti]
MFNDLLFFIGGFSGSMVWNYLSGVPLHRGHPRNLACGLIVGALGHLGLSKLEEMDKVRMYQLEEYVRTHPDDFPAIERKKWGEVFNTWQSPFRPDTE